MPRQVPATDGRAEELGVVIVDYPQAMRGHKSTENRNQEISEIARSLKSLRKGTQSAPSWPLISALAGRRAAPTTSAQCFSDRARIRESIEGRSGRCHLHLPRFLLQDEGCGQRPKPTSIPTKTPPRPARACAREDKVDVAELIIAKQRNGPTGKVEVAFHPAYARFDNLDPHRAN